MSISALLLSPQGRIAPQTYWLGFAILSAISIASLFVPIIGGWLWLATFIPWTMLTTKRLHDMGKSGWFQLVAYAVNIAAVLTSMALLGASVWLTLIKRDIVQPELDAGAAMGATSTLLLTGGLLLFNTVWLIWIGGTPGTPDENRFGRPTNWP